MPFQTEKLSKYESTQKVLRDENGRVLKGSGPVNPFGNKGKLGFSVSDYARRYLNQRAVDDKGNATRRLKILLDKAYAIATAPNSKQSMAAIEFLVKRAFGEVPKELNLTVAALHTLSRLPRQHYQYFAELLAGDDESLLLPADDLQEDTEKDLENIPVAQAEVIE